MKPFFTIQLLLFLVTGFSNARAQGFQMEYINTVGTLQGRGVAEGPGGYFIGGMVQTTPGNNFDNFVVHTDVSGNPIWSFRYTDYTSTHYNMALCANADSGCTITGYADTNNVVYWTVTRLDKNGMILWASKFKNINGNAFPKKIKQTSDGGFVVGAEYVSVNNSYYNVILKLDASGNIQWSKQFLVHTAPVPSRNMEVLQTADGGYMLFGSSFQTNTLTDSRMIRLDGAGHFLWAKSYGGTYSDWPVGMVQLPNGNYVLAMNYYQFVNFGLQGGPMLVFTDSTGNILASKWNPSQLDLRVAGIHTAANGNIRLSGMMYGPIGPFYACGASSLYNANGQLQLIKLYGDSDMEEVFATTPLSDGGQLLAGDVITGNPNTLLLIKTDSLLAVPCNTTDTLAAPLAGGPISYTTLPDDTLLLNKTTYVLQQVAFPQTVVNVCQPASAGNENEQPQPVVFPSPSAGTFTIRVPAGQNKWQLAVYDMNGRCVRKTACEGNEQQVNLEQEPAGLYMLHITSAAGSYFVKVNVVR